MIITSVKAQNVLKYAELQLENLPEKGIIAVSGHNESGKSSIGETVCFALFGRTFSLNPEELEKIINLYKINNLTNAIDILNDLPREELVKLSLGMCHEIYKNKNIYKYINI